MRLRFRLVRRLSMAFERRAAHGPYATNGRWASTMEVRLMLNGAMRYLDKPRGCKHSQFSPSLPVDAPEAGHLA